MSEFLAAVNAYPWTAFFTFIVCWVLISSMEVTTVPQVQDSPTTGR